MENKNNLETLINHNTNLVQTAVTMRRKLQAATEAIAQVLDAADPISAQHEDEPSEFVVPVEDIEGLREVMILIDTGIGRPCWVCGGSGCPECGG